MNIEILVSLMIMTSVSGIHATPIGEFVLGLMLTFVKQVPLCFQLKQEKQWKLFIPAVLRSKTVGGTSYVDIIFSKEQLLQLLTEGGFVVLSLSLTPETDRLIGEDELRTMKPTAYLINVAGGGVVDEEALVYALEEHWIAGARLGVFAKELLPAGSRLWELPNIIFSLHVAGGMKSYNIQATEVFCENLRRYLN